MTVRLALVGGRTFNDYTIFSTNIEFILTKWNVTLPDILQIVSGGASGADTLAEKWAKEHNIPMVVFKPDWDKFGKAAGPMRNSDIVNMATHLIAFPSEDSKGTWDSIAKAQKKGIPTEIVKPVN